MWRPLVQHVRMPMPHVQGIGRATAILFAKKGFNVVVAARDKQRLQYVAQVSVRTS